MSYYQQAAHELWYSHPAEHWEQALPLGNGRMGIMAFGGIGQEKLSLNEDTLWTGRPSFQRPPQADPSEIWKQARVLAHEKRYTEAQQLLEERFTARPTEIYLPLGDLLIETLAEDGKPLKADAVSDYSRRLDLFTAQHEVSYQIGEKRVVRTDLVSFPDQVMVHHEEADGGVLSLKVSFASQLSCRMEACSDRICVWGMAPTYTIRRGENQGKARLIYDEGDRGLRFYYEVRVLPEGGTVHAEGASLYIENAEAVTLLAGVRTNFAGWDKDPETTGKPYIEPVREELDRAEKKGFEAICEEHTQDHQVLYNRTELCLPGGEEGLCPTDERLKHHDEGESDPALYALLFHMGRYLTIASSRPGTQPTNLQGIWNPLLLPPWHCNMTININTEMNYWPTLSTDLEECFEPMLRLIRELAESGRRTASVYYGADGFTSHHNTDLWRLSTPVGNGQPGCCGYAFWPMSGGWMMNHLDEYYRYTGNKAWLEQEGYPLMRECARFYLSVLDEDKAGNLVFAPSTSPEHSYALSDGTRCPVSETTTMTMAIIRDVFRMNLEYAGILEKEKDEVLQKIEEMLPRLKGYTLTSTGAIEEWAEHQEPGEIHHRHISHLYGQHPGREITKEKTPELLEAVRRSLEERGNAGTGWSLGWKINQRARLGDGETALELIDLQLHRTESGAQYPQPGGTYDNMFDAHPPFQIDGNFGAAAGIAEMLVQCDGEEVRVLPALPESWQEGAVRGLRVWGCRTVDIVWKNGKAVDVQIRDRAGSDR